MSLTSAMPSAIGQGDQHRFVEVLQSIENVFDVDLLFLLIFTFEMLLKQVSAPAIF